MSHGYALALQPSIGVSLSVLLFATADGTVLDVINEDDLASPLWSSIDDDPITPDDTDWINNAIVPGTVEYFPLLTDMPTNFGNAETATVVVRYAGVNITSDTLTLFARLYEADEVTTLSDEVSVVTVTADSPFANTSSIPFTGLDTGKGKSIWDTAKLRLRWA